MSLYKVGPTTAAAVVSGRWDSQEPVLQPDAGGQPAWEGTKPNQNLLWTRGPKDQGQMLASARCEPDVSTKPVSLPPYEAFEGTSESPTGDS